MILIDGRGLSCPQPVVLTKKGLVEDKKGIDILVDCNTAKQNIIRYCEGVGYKVTIESKDEDILLKIRK
ncbi:sulfurtransferase TusA family protein [Clostridium gasigenes]|uniref:TusA-related sulfurtransferase n=1 Tax=Clostridium gasigenes TaxID=94869 RepID=A0A1H0VYK0_9CLOT|nr:sulfurtransferase TusA family protein [Clostridium gasigenes]MBB6625319.1 sulfurtransferase TusA family protein [Clostridium gasigenes]MBU3090215.1 sulfurtransferase TusA family protein [Clostridium gasigenes]MBU3107463.1 sulfurtransferase TusA family protein [Clostridium gasigenes]MBU3132713.1 sulfurtransferase TusA family protein [Clostridium gasigenes]NKF05758.1 SirA family protein [Clostridium gasigenes]